MITYNKILLLSLVFIASSLEAQNISDTINLKEVEVADSAIKRTAYIRTVIQKENLQSTSTLDLGEFFRTVPNVSGIRKGGGAVDPVIRGYKFSQINVVIDGGMKLENGCPNRMDPATSHVEIEELSSIEIVKGPYSLSQGPALGGVINLETENPKPFDTFELHGNATFSYESNWNGGKEHFVLYGGNRKVYFRTSGGYREYGNYKSGNSGAEAVTYNTSFRKFNYGAKVSWAISKKQSLLLNYSEVHGRVVMFPALSMDEVSDDTRMLSADYSFKNTQGIFKSLDIKIYQTDVQHLMDNSRRESWKTRQMIADVDAINTGGKAIAGWKFNNHTLKSGIDFENIYKDGVRTMRMQMMGMNTVKKFNLWKAAVIQNAGLFGSYNTHFEKFTLDAGLRIDYNKATSEDTLKLIKNGVEYFDKTSSHYINLSGYLGINRSLTKNLGISIALARGMRSPNMLERYIKLLSVGYDTYDYLGNPFLRPETNNEVDVTFKYSDYKIGNLYVNGFYSYVQKYISSVLLPPSIINAATAGAPGVKQFVNVDYATFTGFEIGYTSPQTNKLSIGLSAAITRGTLPESMRYIIKNGAVTGDSLIHNDAIPEIPPFDATATVTYKMLKGKLTPKLSYRFAAAQNHVSMAFYEAKTPGFSVLNFSVACKINKSIKLTLGANNIFDVAYYEHLNRKIIGTTDKLYEPGRVLYANLFLNI